MESQGERASKEIIKFNKSFQSAPQVMVALNGLDVSKDTNLRVNA